MLKVVHYVTSQVTVVDATMCWQNEYWALYEI